MEFEEELDDKSRMNDRRYYQRKTSLGRKSLEDDRLCTQPEATVGKSGSSKKITSGNEEDLA